MPICNPKEESLTFCCFWYMAASSQIRALSTFFFINGLCMKSLSAFFLRSLWVIKKIIDNLLVYGSSLLRLLLAFLTSSSENNIYFHHMLYADNFFLFFFGLLLTYEPSCPSVGLTSNNGRLTSL